MSDTHGAQFDQYRILLFTVAYEILGSAVDAEDVVQDSYLRWRAVELDQIRYPKAYLVRIATRVALNAARTVQRRRQAYVGPWLPEPIVTTPDVADDVVLTESVSLAMLVVLEALAPTERAVFVLREVFGFDYDEIADAVGKSAAAVRQIAHRARAHVAARRPTVDSKRSVSANLLAQLLEFLQAGDLQAMMSVLAPDVVLIADGGGLRAAALRPIVNADKVARFVLGIAGKTGSALEVRPANINSSPGALYYVDGDLDTIGAIDTKNGKISIVYLVRNPLKLTDLSRSLSR
ncbi:MAG: RNA polymerase sigma-70 factor [Antricoccus sp.]